MKVSCLMITTNVASRLHLLENAINSIEANAGDFLYSKTLSIDVLPRHPFDIKYFEQFEKRGWSLASGTCSGHRGMLNNVIRGLQNTDPCEYIYYCEDDVVITRLPSKKSFEKLATEKTKYGKNIGYACFNTHILSLDKPIIPERVDFINDKSNYQNFGDELFLVKNEDVLRDEYFLNFPSAIVKNDLFRGMISHAEENCSGIGMEPGLTQSWFDLGYNKNYDVAIYVKPDTLSRTPMDLNSFYYTANMQFWNNDESLRHPSINGRKNTIF